MANDEYTLTSLSDHPEYFDEVIELIELEFHYQKSFHFEKDFAPLMDPLNFENCLLFIHNETNKVAAHLAVCPRKIIKEDCELDVALIGGIATSKEHRGKGLFKQLMDEALKNFEPKAGLFILWSDLENLYEKFGFYRTGGFIETGRRNFSASERPSGYEKTKFSSLTEEEFTSLIKLYTNFNQSYFYTVKREEKDWSIIRNMDSIDLFVKRNLSGEIEKYFCVNKGRDLTNIIHEISCFNIQTYVQMLKELEQYKTWLPETEAKRSKAGDIFYTAFMKMGSAELFENFIQKASKDKIHLQEKTEDSVKFQFSGTDYNVSQRDFLQYLFGPRPLQEFEEFGLSLYIAGTDSV